MRILYSAHPLYSTRANEFFQDELGAARAARFVVSTVALEEGYKVKPALEPLECVLYRGCVEGGLCVRDLEPLIPETD